MIIRATSLLLVVTGSSHGDVSPAFVRKRLDVERVAAATVGVQLGLLHGHGLGVDTVAMQWAIDHEIEQVSMAADWSTHGAMAGPIRNRKMIAAALQTQRSGWLVRLLAFPGKQSRGTWDMIKACREAGLTVDLLIEN